MYDDDPSDDSLGCTIRCATLNLSHFAHSPEWCLHELDRAQECLSELRSRLLARHPELVEPAAASPGPSTACVYDCALTPAR